MMTLLVVAVGFGAYVLHGTVNAHTMARAVARESRRHIDGCIRLLRDG